MTKLQAHRLYKRNEAAHIHSGLLTALCHCAAGGLALRNGDLVIISQSENSRFRLSFSHTPSVSPLQSSAGLTDLTVAPGVPPSGNAAVNKKVSAWLQQSHQPDACVQGEDSASLERLGVGIKVSESHS